MSDSMFRRLIGLALGALFGLGFGLVSQTINAFFLPGVPLHQPPFGPAGNIAAVTAGAALLGLISAWPENTVIGILLGSTASMGVFVLNSVLQMRADPELKTGVILISLIFLLLPLVALAVPAVGLLRWAANKQAEARHDREPLRKRILFPLALFLAVSALGAITLYRADARTVLARMNLLLQEGQRTGAAADLPEKLATVPLSEVGDFRTLSQGAYTLAWEKDDENRYRIPRPITSTFDQSVAVARFANGYTLACLFPTPIDEPECRQFP
jgi:uncharacterized membrane protein YidH (DUF202 family)